jgi:hypothetical protein
LSGSGNASARGISVFCTSTGMTRLPNLSADPTSMRTKSSGFFEA